MRARCLALHRVPSVIALCVALGAAHPAAADPVKHTLAELIQIARQRSRGVAVAKSERAMRVTQKHEALWSWAPSLDLSVGVSPFVDVQCVEPLADDLPLVQAQAQSLGMTPQQLRMRDCAATIVPENGNSGGWLSTFSLGMLSSVSGALFSGSIRLTQPLFTFGKIEFSTQAAGHGIAAAEAQIDAQRDEVDLLTARAYWGLKAARATLATIEEIRGKLQPWVEKVERDLDAEKPKYTLTDLRRLQLGMIEIEILLSDQTRNAATALHGLQLLVGEDDADIDDSELDLVEIVEQPLDYYELEARTHRPELRALDEGVAASRALARASVANMLPNLALLLSGNIQESTTSVEDSSSAYQNHINYIMFGAALGLSGHFDFAQLARWQHARVDTATMSAQRALAGQGYSLEIAQAYNDLAESRRRVAITNRGQKLSRGWFTSLDDSVEPPSPFDLVEAARNYFYMRLRYFQAIYETNLNVARLRRASGVEVAR